MALYRVMLVDDEEEVRTSIIKKIDWERAGYEVVGDAENGEEALEKAIALEPDVVITDIRMPFMDGLTLGSRLRELLPSIKLVIFSGFDDFEYAKQAIKINVVEYVLKPVNVEELTSILGKIKSILDKEIAQRTDVETLRLRYIKSLPVMREKYLTDLLEGRLSKEHEVDRDNYKISDGRYWTAALFFIEKLNTLSSGDEIAFHKEKELIPFSVKQLADEKLQKSYSVESLLIHDNVCVIATFNTEDEISGFIHIMNDICKESKRILELNVSVGIGALTDDINNINTSYLGAQNALDYKVILGEGKAIYIKDVEPNQITNLKFDDQCERELLTVIKFGSEEDIRKVVDTFIGKFKTNDLSFQQYQVYLLGIVGALLKVVQGYELDAASVFGNDIDYFQRLGTFQSMEEMRQWLYSITINLSSQINKERTSAANQIVISAKQYIQENYMDLLLSVEMICEYLHISTAYFSTLFKKETGQSYVAYLTEVRLNKAVELLNQTDYKTYMIAEKVGYAEPNYFSYVFKKQYGISPSKYRGK